MTLNGIEVSSVPDRELKDFFLPAFRFMNLHTSYAVLRCGFIRPLKMMHEGHITF